MYADNRRPVRIRPFRPSDLPRVLRIEHASFGRDAWPREAFEEYALTFPRLFLIAAAGMRLVGYSIACISGKAGEIASIAVLPAYRGRGIARALLAATLGRLRRRGLRSVWLMVRPDNTGAIALYRRAGFVRTSTIRGYYEDGGAGWRMRRSLIRSQAESERRF
jgi:ribosomal-protein-alanine acetyltransferase